MSDRHVNDHLQWLSSQRTMQIQYLRCARHQNKCKKWKRSDLSRHLRPGCRPLCNYVYRNYRDYSNHRFWLDANLRRSKRQESNQSKILTHQCAYRSAHRRVILPHHQTCPIYRERFLKIHSHSGVIPRSRRSHSGVILRCTAECSRCSHSGVITIWNRNLIYISSSWNLDMYISLQIEKIECSI